MASLVGISNTGGAGHTLKRGILVVGVEWKDWRLGGN